MATTLVFGGAGFLGVRLARALVDRGEAVVLADLVPAAGLDDLGDKVRRERGDVTRLEEVLAAVKAHRPARVVNLAYVLTAEAEQAPHAAVLVNALGMSHVFEAARLLEVPRIVYASSISVYGDQATYGERPITEADPPAPVSLYGSTKLANEHEAALYARAHGLSLTGVRISVAFGHGRSRGRSAWAGAFVSSPAVGRPADFPYHADTRWSMIYADDVAELLARITLAPAPRHPVYNTGGTSACLGELAARVRALLPDARFAFGDRGASSPHMVDGSRAEAEFAWTPRPLADALAAHVAEARRAAGVA